MLKIAKQFSKFVIVGGLSFILDYLLYYAFTRFFHIHYQIAATLSFSLSLIFNYLASMKFVFRSRDSLKKHHEFMIFAILSVLGLGLNLLCLYVMVDGLAIPDLYAKVVAAGIVMVFNFVTRKIFIEQK